MKKHRRGNKARTVLFPSDATCKICLENTSLEDLIHPCKCTGSIYYVHEECLKTWILSTFRVVDEARCELCNHPYLMEYRIGSVCNCSKETCTWNGRIVLLTKLFFIQALIWFMVVSLFWKLEEGRHPIFLVVFLFISIMAILASWVLIIFLIAKQWIAKQMKDWVIFNYEGPASETSLESSPLNPSQLVIPGTVVARGLRVLPPKCRNEESKARTYTENDVSYRDSQRVNHHRRKSHNVNSLSKLSDQ